MQDRGNKLILKKASPGTFFVLFGTAIIIFSLWKGQELYSTNLAPQPAARLIASGESKIAFETIKEIISGSQAIDSLSQFELQSIQNFLSKIENQENADPVISKRGRGIASEE